MSFGTYFAIAGILFIVVLGVLGAAINILTRTEGEFRYVLLTGVLCWFSNDIDKQDTKLDDETKTTILVSTSPPQLGTSGEAYYGFMYGSFYVDNDIAYIVRTEKDGGYKDLVVKDTLIKEDSSLNNTGYLKEYYSCNHVDISYRLWLFPVKGESYKECKLDKKIIYVPKGAVQKGVKI